MSAAAAIEFVPGYTVRGKVVDENGAPVTGCGVMLFRLRLDMGIVVRPGMSRCCATRRTELRMGF